jgi:hypothetical protein
MTAEKFEYNYECPSTLGYTKFNLTAKQKKEIFPNYKQSIGIKYVYWINDNEILVQKFDSAVVKFTYVILAPILVLVGGIPNYFEDLKNLFAQKKRGKFAVDHIYCASPKFIKIKEIIANKK